MFCPRGIMDTNLVVPIAAEISNEEERFKEMMLLDNSDEKRLGALAGRLKEGAVLGRNEYPRAVADMYELMSTHCPDQPSRQNNYSQKNRNGVSLRQHSTNKTPHTLRQIGILLTQSNDDIINPNWFLLDTCSTDSVFKNQSLLSAIRKCKKENILKIITNGGSVTYNTVGKFYLFGIPVCFNEQS